MPYDADHQRQIEEAEELLGERLNRTGFAKGLFHGHFLKEKLLSYPEVDKDPQTNSLLAEFRQFCQRMIDPVVIDQTANIPESVITGLGELGVLGACLPPEMGGRGLSQTSYCQLLEELGAHCGSTALFVNAHHSIGPRAIVLFGTLEQQQKWLPRLATGEHISAFALTEPEAGSDAANVKTMATPSADGIGYLLNGEKRWITNGSIAQVLTVMARTPVPGSDETKITAFLVTPDMSGFEVVEARMPKMGCRGTVTSRLRFTDMFVPNENILGPLGKGLKVALTVLDFGRTTFGACCTGAAKFCCTRSLQHVLQRVQFGRTLASFELVKQKVATMQADSFAMESATYQTALLIDSGEDDYMLETAMLKVFATDRLWHILGETFQVHGGMAYFNDQPFERMIRDARINTIGEGSNDVLRTFIALIGLRDVGLELQAVRTALERPLTNLGQLAAFVGRRVERWFDNPRVKVQCPELEKDALVLSRLIAKFGSHVERLLRRYQQSILDAQYQLARISDAATELYISGCVLCRLERLISDPAPNSHEKLCELAIGRYYLITARRRIQQNLAALWDHDDAETTQIADLVMQGHGK